MHNPLIYFLVLLIVLGLLASSVVLTPMGRKWLDQKKADRDRQRAHDGKLQCEDVDCDDVAVMLTPNGYFCEWHWGPMSKRQLPGGGSVVYNHRLYHSIRRA